MQLRIQEDGFGSGPLLALAALLDFIQGHRKLRSSESVILDQQGVFPSGERGNRTGGESGGTGGAEGRGV